MHGTISVGDGPFAALVPTQPDYVVAPIGDAFNWSECLAAVDDGEWYVVSFRSVRRLDSDDEMLAAVRDLLLEHGPRGVTTAAISERSGAPTGSLYHRFGSRSNMVAELWIRTIQKFHAEFFAATDAAEPGMARAIAGVTQGATTSTRAPASSRRGSRRVATAPPPTTTTRRPASRRPVR